MTVEEAKKLIEEIIKESEFPFDEETSFKLDELTKFIFKEQKDGANACYIGTNYRDQGKYDQALYYYELAIQYGYEPAYEYAADLYHDGDLSSGVDFKKAFEYYTKASTTKEVGDGSFENPGTDVHNDAKIALANMYDNGEYVEKNHDKYIELIKEVYEELKDSEFYTSKPYVEEEMAYIALEEDDKDACYQHLTNAICLKLESVFNSKLIDEVDAVNQLVNLKYKIFEINKNSIFLEDIFYLLNEPCKLSFTNNGAKHYIESLIDDNKLAICFDNNQWFREINDMFIRAKLEDKDFIEVAEDTENWEVEK